ncbi:MAG TPA: ABC transporter permease [Gemmatimonadaceae bacterium]|jgi:putative ABC transport system permease protein|nr:ABC transporter permease [Gemmatimonadaceae bacterium]
MSILEAVRLALSQLRVQKLKSFFTLLGVTIGVMFLIAVVSIVNGMGRVMEEDLVGKIIAKGSYELRRRPNIVMGDVDEATWRSWSQRRRIIEDDVEPVVAGLEPGTRWAITSGEQEQLESRYARPRSVELTAVSEQWFDIKNMGVSEGRLIAPQEYQLGIPVIVIGEDVKKHFFPGLSPLGREISINNLPYKVVGVAESQGSFMGISMDRFAIVPFKSPAHRLVNRFKVIDGLIVKSPNEQVMATNMEATRTVMRSRHRLRPSQPDDFTMQTADAALEFWKKIEGIMVVAGIALPAIGLIVGAIVIMNIMLVAVAERTREIGVRKALGARRRDILGQFLVESTTLSLVGAITGILAGIGVAQAVKAASPLPATVALWSVLVAVTVGAGVGIISGVYPASRAARLDPVVALRQE